jgi:hypothetical protein
MEVPVTKATTVVVLFVTAVLPNSCRDQESAQMQQGARSEVDGPDGLSLDGGIGGRGGAGGIGKSGQ